MNNIDLRANTDFDSIYFQAKSLRNNTRRLERESLLNESQANSVIHDNWLALYNQAQDILQNHSIDIEACSWLIEASVRLNGLDGLIAAWDRTYALLESHWPNVFPSPSENATPHPFKILASLNGEERDGSLIMALKNLPISNPEIQPIILCWEYPNKQNDAQINLTQTEFYHNQLEKLSVARATFDKLMNLLHSLDGENNPPSQNIMNTLLAYQQVLHDILYQRGVEQDTSDKSEKSNNLSESTVTKRQTALLKIIEIADYFEKHEPHSPLSILLKRCARWGELPLNKLLNEMIRDQNSRQSVFGLIGIENEK